MSEELFQLYSPEQVMIVTSPHFQSTTSATDNSTAAFINNPAEDFIIYSQDNNYSQSSDNGLFSNISHVVHQQSIVGDYVAVDSTFNSPHNSHIESPIIEDLCYTEIDQSILAQASPHGNSINNNPSLRFPTNNIFVSPQSPFTVATPVVGTDIILGSPQSPFTVATPVVGTDIILGSPIPLLGTPQQQQRLYNDIRDLIRTPGTHTVSTPITTPLTSWEPYYSDFSSLENTPIIAPQTPATPYTPLQPLQVGGDPQLYDNNIGQDWYSLFPPFPYCTMPEITVEGEKKPEISELTMGTPNSATSTSEKSPSLTVHEQQPSELDQLSSTIDTIDVKNSETKSPTHSSDSAHTTPANTPRLVPIRPRESGENSEPIRRSKRQRRSVSQDLDDDDEVEDEGDDKKYSCPDCGRGFNRKFNMQTHRTTHDPNRVKPFACEHPNCGSRFTRKHDLKRHINGIHKGEKVHECSVCLKPFSRKDAWKRHNATCGKV